MEFGFGGVKVVRSDEEVGVISVFGKMVLGWMGWKSEVPAMKPDLLSVVCSSWAYLGVFPIYCSHLRNSYQRTGQQSLFNDEQ